jgi:hypothetical protein
MLKKGSKVKQIVQAAIEGEVVRVERDGDGEPTGNYLVEWEADGVTHSKYFSEKEVEEVANG